MKILITGVTGFLGGHIFDYLKMKKVSATVFKGDLREQSNFTKGYFDYIIHSAALVDKKYWKQEQLFSVNVDGTRNIINYYKNSKVIFISSTDVINKPETPYGQSKLIAEEIINKNKNNLIIRLPSIFGTGDKHKKLIPLLFNKYLNNGECQLNNNDVNIYVFVMDVVKFIFKNINQNGLLEMSGTPVKNFDLDGMIRSICDLTGKQILQDEYIDFYEKLKKCKNYYKK